MRVVAFAIAAAALVAAAIFLWSRAAPGAPPLANANEAASVEPPAPRAGAPAAAPLREASPLREGLEVEVRTESGAPFANAQIRVTGDDATLRLPPTDANGLARADRLPTGSITLHVAQDGRSGLASWHPDDARRVRIVTQRGLEIEVAVRDEHEAPVSGLRVRLLPRSGISWVHTAPEAATGDDGCARFTLPATDQLARQPALRAQASNGSRQVTSADERIATGAPTRVAITFPSREVDTGLLLRFRERDGSPAHVLGELDWSYMMQPPLHNRIGFEHGSVDGTTFRIDDARATDMLMLWLREPGRVEVVLQAEMPADANRNEVAVTRGGAMPRLAIPLVDAGGAPVTGGEYLAYVSSESGFGQDDTVSLAPDANGVLTVSLRHTGPGAIEIARPHRPAELHWPPRENMGRPYNSIVGEVPPLPPALAVFAFGDVAADQEVRLPPVVVPALATRLTGRVVDAARRPVAGVRIGITATEREPKDSFAHFATHTDADGRFAIVATSLPASFHVFGRQRLGFCAPVLAHPGGEVELTLQATGTVAFATLADESRRVRFTLRPDASSLRDGWWALCPDDPIHRERTARNGTDVVYADLPPCRYELRAYVGPNLVRTAAPVFVRSGETTRPADFDGQAFTLTIERTAVRVRGPDGQPLHKAFVRVVLPEWREVSPGGELKATDANGEAWFDVPRRAIADVEITAERLAPTRLSATSFPIDATMTAGTSLDVAIAGHGELAKRALIVNCRPHGASVPDTPIQQIGTERYLHHPQCALDDAGRATIPNLAPGTWRVWVAALPKGDDVRGITFVLLGDVVTSAARPHLDLPHTLTADELTTLGGR